MTHLSVKTLRRYHESGPAGTHPDRSRSNYRYYETALQRLLDPTAVIDVQRRTTARTVAAATSATVALPDVLTLYGEAMDELSAVLAAAAQVPTGPPGGLYDNELFIDERGRLVVYVPVAQPDRSGRVQPLVIPPTDVAVTLHRGAHDDIDVTYGALGAWVDQHGLAIAGPVHETYLVGPRDTPEEDAWRTEIGWPIVPDPGAVDTTVG